MAFLRIGLLLSALLLAGACDRLAGTEVGNPEITVSARFALQDSDATASIPSMNLKVVGMDWSVGADSGGCWNEPNGHMVDFAAYAQSPLPVVKVRDGEWSQAEMMLQSPTGDALPAAIPSFATWSNPRHAKIVKLMGADTLRFLFEMPADMRIRLMFDKATIAAWRKDTAITVEVRFDVGRWASGLGADRAFTFRTDGKRVRYVLLSPRENALAYEAMKALLPKAFMADSANYAVKNGAPLPRLY
jgi:hypothetical protein